MYKGLWFYSIIHAGILWGNTVQFIINQLLLSRFINQGNCVLVKASLLGNDLDKIKGKSCITCTQFSSILKTIIEIS